MLNEIEAAQVGKSQEFISLLTATLEKETAAFNERRSFLVDNIQQHQFLLIALENTAGEVE
jgi:hypothetical protein